MAVGIQGAHLGPAAMARNDSAPPAGGDWVPFPHQPRRTRYTRAMARYHRIDYSRRLSRRITLADGTRLVTLKDAADLLTGERFVGVTKWSVLEHAIELMLEAGERGGRARLKAATDQIERVLRGRQML